MTNPRLGQVVEYVMEGTKENVPAWIAYIDADNPGHVNLCLMAGCKQHKGYLPTCTPRLDVEYDANEGPMTWHFQSNA